MSTAIGLYYIYWLPFIVILPHGNTIQGTQVSNYDHKRMLALIKSYDNIDEQLSLASSTWGKLRADFTNDVPKIEGLSDTIKYLLCNQPQKNISLTHNLQAHLLREQIRVHLTTLNTTALYAQALQQPEAKLSKWRPEIAQHAEKLLCLFKPKQLEEIFRRVVRKLYTLERAALLAEYLSELYKPGNQDSYEVWVSAELQLFEQYESRGKQQAEFGKYMADLWQNMQYEKYYKELDPELKQRLLDAAIGLLSYL